MTRENRALDRLVRELTAAEYRRQLGRLRLV